MAKTLTIDSTDYEIPEQGDPTIGWGTAATNWMEAVTNKAFFVSGGSYTLSADLDFGASFGLIANYYKSSSADIADSGEIRLANGDSIGWRNAANDANLLLALDSDDLQFNGVDLVDVSSSQTLTNKTLTSPTIGGLTASRALETDGSGNIQVSAVTAAELNYLDGVTSAIQTQIDGKLTDPMTTDGDLIIENSGPARLAIGSSGQVLKVGAGGLPEWGAVAGSGDVVGPSSSTDLAIPRFNGTGGDTLEESGITTAENGALNFTRQSLAVSGNSNGYQYIGITDTSSPRTITLQDADKVAGRMIYIKDESGGAQSNNITISPASGTIDGESSKVISQNYGSTIVTSDGSNWFTVGVRQMIDYSIYSYFNTNSQGRISLSGATLTSGSASVTVSDTSELQVGMYVRESGGDIPDATQIISIDSGTTFTMSNDATGSGSVTLIAGENVDPSLAGGVIKSGAGKVYKAFLQAALSGNLYGERNVLFYDKASYATYDLDTPIFMLSHKNNDSTTKVASTPTIFDVPDGLSFSNGLAYLVFQDINFTSANNYTDGALGINLNVLYT